MKNSNDEDHAFLQAVADLLEDDLLTDTDAVDMTPAQMLRLAELLCNQLAGLPIHCTFDKEKEMDHIKEHKRMAKECPTPDDTPLPPGQERCATAAELKSHASSVVAHDKNGDHRLGWTTICHLLHTAPANGPPMTTSTVVDGMIVPLTEDALRP